MLYIAIHLMVQYLEVAIILLYITTQIKTQAAMLQLAIHTTYQVLLMEIQFSLMVIIISKLLKLKYT